jgi:predicted TIM-barrel fold metal-dependent hydrolase
MDAKEPEKKMPSTAVNATRRSDGVEEILALGWVLDVCVDEKGVGLGVNVLHHNSEPTEATNLCCLNFIRERVNESTKVCQRHNNIREPN